MVDTGLTAKKTTHVRHRVERKLVLTVGRRRIPLRVDVGDEGIVVRGEQSGGD
jgi:hypothetical protein